MPISRSTFFLVVGSGRNPEYPQKKLFLWDQENSRNVAATEFKETIEEVLFCVRYIVVITTPSPDTPLTNNLYLFDWEAADGGLEKEMHSIKLTKSIKGKVSIACAADGSNLVLIFPQ